MNNKRKRIAIFVLIMLVVTGLLCISYPQLFVSLTHQPSGQRVVDFPSVKKGELLFLDLDGSAWLLDETYQSDKNLRFDNKHIYFNHLDVTADDWDYISIDPNRHQWVNYSWEFDIKRKSEFREFAFNFRNLDFDNRYRYRFEDNKIFFDKKVHGQWTNNIASIEYPIALDKQYHVRIDVVDSIMRCYVDGVLKLENVDTDIASGSIAIILWEDDGQTNIEAEVSNNVVHRLII